MPIDNAEVARVMAIKAALTITTTTQGWAHVKQMADNIVKKTTDEALDEEDREKGETKRLKASALKKGFAELFNAIETTKGFQDSSADDNDFGSLDFELALQK